MRVYGFRTGGLGYVTDAKPFPPCPGIARRACACSSSTPSGSATRTPRTSTWRRPWPARDLGAERTFLTHLTHRLRHDTLAAALPPDIQPAYDWARHPD
jgi:phosphoribosyl 1,2-cyclic phosphate phosphodiesterase